MNVSKVANLSLANAVDVAGLGYVWVLCRREQATNNVDCVRAFTDEDRAREDLALAESISGDEFWISTVPLVQLESAAREPELSSVQALALTWLAQGAEAEPPRTGDPVVISPRHVRGFASVPPEEWHLMEERGWVADGAITPAGHAALSAAATR